MILVINISLIAQESNGDFINLDMYMAHESRLCFYIQSISSSQLIELHKIKNMF